LIVGATNALAAPITVGGFTFDAGKEAFADDVSSPKSFDDVQAGRKRRCSPGQSGKITSVHSTKNQIPAGTI
jgi:hypothetical protein